MHTLRWVCGSLGAAGPREGAGWFFEHLLLNAALVAGSVQRGYWGRKESDEMYLESS